MLIKNYNDFVQALLTTGFSMGGENNEGVFALSHYFDQEVEWHTGIADLDPWEWRIRVLEERNDIAYSKLFFKKSGFITREWYSVFYAVRRGRMQLQESFEHGLVGRLEKQIYDIISENGTVALHDIKRMLCIGKEDNRAFDKAMVDLQMKLYITTCGRKQKTNQFGEDYGWSSTVFSTVEHFWGEDFIDQAGRLNKEMAIQKISEQICVLNPQCSEKKIKKFISGE